ncbi:LysM peptidoglycan-binding domain-containing protein [Candidatus Falkowbacteria bacterium]|nr:LysM peptidoglycan-binding domain-containing protein [Candidatus Falkowbacteria bacterium]
MVRQVKQRILQVVAFALVLAAASAGAETYAVRKGDCLSKIAVRHDLRWRKLYEANRQIIKNPDLIFPGQILTIPTSTTIVAKTAVAEKHQAVIADEYTPLNDLGQHAFGQKRDGIKAIKMFSLPQEVKQLFIVKVQKGEFEFSSLKSAIRSGDKFSEMVFGNYKITKNKIASWDVGHLEPARLYQVEFEGLIYSLYDPLKCRNLAWRAEKPKKRLLILLIPPPVEPLSPAVQPPPPLPPEQPITEPEEKVCCRPDVDISVGAFADIHQSGNNPHGFWGVGNFYLCSIKDGDKIHSFGVTVEGNYWSGITGDDYNYFGRRYAIGPTYRLLSPNTEFQFRVGMGEVDDWGFIDPNEFGRYKSDQTSKIITAYTGYEKSRTGSPWFNRMRYYASMDYDINQNKTDKWMDRETGTWPLDGEASDKTMFSAGIDGSVYKLNETVSLAGGASVTHYKEGSMTGLRVSPGVDFYGSGNLIGGARINPTYWSTSDHSVGLGGFIDLTNLAKHLLKKKAKSQPPKK